MDPRSASATLQNAPTAAVPESNVVPQRPPSDPNSDSSRPGSFVLGDRIGEGARFEIVEKVGGGGMGHVFRAIDTHLDRTVAIKFILENGGLPLEQLVALLRREAKATAKLNHENIVAIFDMDAYEGVPFLVMELLDGQSLDAMMDRSRLGPLRATEIMIHVARGLAHAHANGIIHRDLKPSNVFILRDGRAKILDFGISRGEHLVASPFPVSDAGVTISMGTPAFMAPEQWRGEPQDARTDIWAAGVMFYQMLTDRLPYAVPELVRRFTTRSETRPLAPSVRLVVPTLPDEAESLVATALNEDPAGRFQGARELLDALVDLERVLVSETSRGEISARGAPRVERRPLTLLACALDGDGSLDLDDVAELEQHFYEVCVDAVTRADGCVGVPMGGKFFCCFGYPVVKETDAQRAVRVALQIAEAMGDHAPRSRQKLDFKIGVHSGVVGLPNFAGVGQGIPALQGDVPNVAARVAEGAVSNSVGISQATFELTGGFFVTELAGEGNGGRPRIYRVTGEVESESRFERMFAAHLAPFVGRESELSLLYELWDEAKEGRGQIAVVMGEPGIGKSRLVQMIRSRVIDEQNTRLTCQCWPQFRNSALHPLVQLILRSMGIHSKDSPEEKHAKLENNLVSLGLDLSLGIPLLASLLSILPAGRQVPPDLSPEQRKQKTLEALVSMLVLTASRRPTLFVIEDMHWVDHSTVEYLTTLFDSIRSSPILVVLTGRPEFHVPWSPRPHLHEIVLDRLPVASVALMVEQVSKERPLPLGVKERLIATADGVPLFAEELTRMVLESSQPDDPMFPSARMAIPGTLHELLRARLDRLRGVGKDVAQIGSILGRDFDYGLIRRVAPLDELSLQEGLLSLSEAGILHPQGLPPTSKYVFKHALIQQAAYESLVRGDRQRHHKRAAQVLTDLSRETADLQPEILAYHHSEAGNTREAILCWERAGQRDTQRSALVEAIDHYTKALEALKTLPLDHERDKKELALLLAVGSPLMSVHGYATPEVEKTYARARELARASGAQADVFPALQGLWQFYFVRGMLPVSRELGEQILEIAREAGSSTFLLLAHRSVASSAFLQGDYETCRLHTQEGFRVYDRHEHGSLALRTGHDPGVAHGVYLAWALWMLGYPDQALQRVNEMVDLAKLLEHPMTMAYALCFAALMRNHRGDHAKAVELSDAALEITGPNKFALWTAWARMQRGWGIAGMGDYHAGIPEMKEGLLGWKNTGARVGFTFFPVTLAEMCLHAGHFSETARLLEEAAPMIANNDEHFYEPEMCRVEAELVQRLALGGSDSSDAAATHYRRGLDLARKLKGKSWELRLVMGHARLLARSGERGQALSELRQSLSWFTEGHETADLRAARALSESLATPC